MSQIIKGNKRNSDEVSAKLLENSSKIAQQYELKRRRVKRINTDSISLPISSYEKDIVNSVNNHVTTVIIGETGSGKSTQIPQYLIDSFKYKSVVCTQPRRVAAVTIAQRVADERDCLISDEVGYSIRFEDKTSHNTKIKYVTDGVLLREIVTNPKLTNYDVVILDEAHERSLQTDILMGLLRKLQDERKDLKVVVMSATLQVELFMNFFKDPHLVTIPGRQYPVDIYYLREPESDYVDAAMLACLQIHGNEQPGDVLVFLPGQDEIESLQNLLDQNLPNISMFAQKQSLNSNSNSDLDLTANESANESKSIIESKHGIDNEFVVLPLYSSLSADEQLRAFQPSPSHIRKFILATNIAETSVTISGIKYVIDTGYVKTRLLQSTTSVEMLKITAISQSQSNQRAGRAGRECPGKCFRLFTETAFENLPVTSIPEIQRVNISQVILQLKLYGIANLRTDFHFLSPPSTTSLKNALEELLLLGALDKNQKLTDIGHKMAHLPLDPVYANLLLKSQEFRCVSEVLTAVSMLSSDNIFIHPYREADKHRAYQAHRRFSSTDGDLLTLVTIYQAWCKVNQDIHWCHNNFISYRSMLHAQNIRQQLVALLDPPSRNIQGQIISSNKPNIFGIDPMLSSLPNKEPFLKCLAAGLCLQIAKKSSSINYNPSHNNQKFHARQAFSDQFSSKNNKNNNSVTHDDERAPYKTLRGGQPVHIHPSSTLFSSKNLPEYVTYGELLTTSKNYMRNVTAIDMRWLPEVAPHVIKGVYYEESVEGKEKKT